MKYFFVFVFLFFSLSGPGQTRSLPYYIGLARVNSPLLKGFQNQILANKTDSLILLASLRPQVNFVSNNAYAPVINGWGYDNAITNGANISGLVQARKDFISRKYLNSLQRSFHLQNQGITDTMKIAEQDLIRTVADQYIMAYGDMMGMDYTNEIYLLLKQEDSALKKLTRDNIYKQTDYLAFLVTMQQQELNYMQSKILYDADYLILGYLCGINDTSSARLEEPLLKDTLVTDLPSSVFYRRWVTDSLRISNERRLIDFTYKPKISAFTDAGYLSSLQYTAYKNFGISAGVSLAIPIYDGKQKILKYNKLDLEERTRVAEKEFFINQYNQQIAQLYRELRSTETMIEKINQQVLYTSTLINADLKLLETGDIKLTDLVLSINNYFNARNLLRQNKISKLKIINQINYWNR